LEKWEHGLDGLNGFTQIFFKIVEFTRKKSVKIRRIRLICVPINPKVEIAELLIVNHLQLTINKTPINGKYIG
jgi:hypothetical protein